MKKRLLSVAIILSCIACMTLNSCIGSFALTNKVLAWNNQVGNKFVNELVFVAFCIIPVYEITAAADLIVINSIEFWSGENPVVAANTTTVIDGEDGRYLVKCDGKGYDIISERDGSSFRFAFNEDDNSWAIEKDGKSITFMSFIDNTHVRMLTPNGDFNTVEISQNGVLAYKQAASSALVAMR